MSPLYIAQPGAKTDQRAALLLHFSYAKPNNFRGVSLIKIRNRFFCIATLELVPGPTFGKLVPWTTLQLIHVLRYCCGGGFEGSIAFPVSKHAEIKN